MHKKPVLLILLGCAIGIWLAAAWLKENSVANVVVAMSRTADNEWFVSYKFDEPVQRATFVRNPDHSRIKRWQPLEPDYYLAIDSETDQEYIARVDGNSFNSVAFQLTPSYVMLRKDYAPFAPFSDGGVGWFSGRFKVCPESCSSALRFTYDFSMQAPLSDYIRLPGESARGELQWREEASDGVVVYVGPQAPREALDDGLQTIIDPILPDSLKQRLARDVPPMKAFFNQRLPLLEQQPMLLASFSPTDNGRFGYQGGVIGNQMMLHWYGHSMAERATAPYFVEDTLWFVAHEIAHLYQGGQFTTDQAWIHEGAAEFMALSYLRSIYANGIYLQHRVRSAEEKCASTSDPIEIHYACGLLWAQQIDDRIRQQYPHGLYFLWFTYVNELATQGRRDSADLYFELLAQLTDEVFAQQLRAQVAARYPQL